jgi:hypothetical protein
MGDPAARHLPCCWEFLNIKKKSNPGSGKSSHIITNACGGEVQVCGLLGEGGVSSEGTECPGSPEACPPMGSDSDPLAGAQLHQEPPLQSTAQTSQWNSSCPPCFLGFLSRGHSGKDQAGLALPSFSLDMLRPSLLLETSCSNQRLDLWLAETPDPSGASGCVEATF